LLYSVAPGFVALFAVWVADQEDRLGVRGVLFAKDYEWRGVGAGVLLGLVSYAVHLAVLEDWMFWIVLCRVRCKYRDEVPPQLQNEKAGLVISKLTRERWTRSASEGRAAAAQAGLDETYLWLFFLYCSGYLLVIGGVLLLFLEPWRGLLVFGSGLVFLVTAFVGDTKATRHEMWLACRERPHGDVAIEAYYLWESEGRPEGRSEEHWSLAEERVRWR
jgi:hypothetical protein